MISVLLPTYNAASTITSAVSSILQQTVTEFELLILDDGSTDDTEIIVRSKGDARMQYHRFPHRGLTRTLNDGLALARYDIIARMDADDLSVPWRFQTQLQFLEDCPPQTIISSWYAVFDRDRIQYCIKTPVRSEEIKKGLLLHSFLSHPGLMFRKNVLLDHGGYHNNVPLDAFQDYETWLKLKDVAVFTNIPEVLVFHRYRPNSLSNTLRNKRQTIYTIQAPYYKDLQREFTISSVEEEHRYRGWREYFYGSRVAARMEWKKIGAKLFYTPKVLAAFLISYLPEPFFTAFIELRLRYRLETMTSYFSAESVRLRKTFESMSR